MHEETVALAIQNVSNENFNQTVGMENHVDLNLCWVHMSNFLLCDIVTQFIFKYALYALTLLMLNMTYPVLANSVDPYHLASEEAN